MRIREKIRDLRAEAGLKYATGEYMGLSVFLKYFDLYRKWVGFGLFVISLVLILLGYWELGFIGLCFVHVHILLNQLWWKLVNVEHGLGVGVDKVEDKKDGEV